MSTSEKKPVPIPPPAPIEYAGQWVAWNKEWTEIVAHGREFADVHREAIHKGFSDPIMEHVRNPKLAFIGFL